MLVRMLPEETIKGYSYKNDIFCLTFFDLFCQ